MAGWFNRHRDLDGLYLVCSTTRDRFTAQELIFETLTLCVRGRVLSILLCISAWHRKERILGPTRAACRVEVAVWNYVYFKLDLRIERAIHLDKCNSHSPTILTPGKDPRKRTGNASEQAHS